MDSRFRGNDKKKRGKDKKKAGMTIKTQERQEKKRVYGKKNIRNEKKCHVYNMRNWRNEKGIVCMATKTLAWKEKNKGMIFMRSFGRLKDTPSGRQGIGGDPS